MLPYAVASDVHLHNWQSFSTENADGVNNRLRFILNELERVADTVKKEGGNRIVITGDLFHVRGSIAPSVLNPTIETFQKICQRRHAPYLNVVIIAGNHDLESKDSQQLSNACESLSAIEGVTVVSTPQIDFITKSVYVPWYDSLEELIKTIKNCISLVEDNGSDHKEFDLFIHAPMNEIIVGLPGHGLDPSEVADWGFNNVFCGHYHNAKEVRAGVYSSGALTHQTWGDVDTKAGFWIVDEFEIKHHESLAPKFVKYDSAKISNDQEALELCEGNYVKVKLDDATQVEVQQIKEYLLESCLARAVVVEATPKAKVTTRATSATSSPSANLLTSVGTFIDSRTTKVDKSKVFAQCEDILSQVRGV